mgnify:CR=1 FL=1
MPTKFVCVDEDTHNTQARLKEKLLAENEQLRKVLELIAKHNPHDPYIQWQVKELIA